MAQATDTLLGEIQLAGDLAGDGSPQVGTNPQLTTIPGLVPGHYTSPRITVDSKGRITAIQNGLTNLSELINRLPTASATQRGILSIGENIHVSSEGEPGYWVANFGGTLTPASPTGFADQPCAKYSFSMMVNNQTNVEVEVSGSDAQTVAEFIAAANDQQTLVTVGLLGGNLVVASNTLGPNSRVEMVNPGAIQCIAGFVSVIGETEGVGDCEIYVKRGSISDYGVVKVGNGINVTNGVISVDMANIVPATATTQGAVIVPTSGNLKVDVQGNISVPLATDTVPGVIRVGTGLSMSNGVLSVNMPNATSSTLGVVRLGANLVANNGVISVPNATSSTIGVARVGAGLSSVGGVISLAVATQSSLGAVKGGGLGIGIAADGTITAEPVQVPDATTTSKGIVQIGSGISVASGVISVADATTTSKGVVSIGNGLSVTNGVVSAREANGTTTKGVVASANTSRISIVNGMIDLVSGSFPSTAQFNTYTKAQVTALVDLGSGTSFNVDCQASNTFKISPTGNFAITTVGAVAGGVYTIVINTPAQQTAIGLPSSFKFPGGGRPTPSTNSRDILSCVFDGTNFLCTYSGGMA